MQTETEPKELILNLPEDTETLTLIQGYATGNKSVQFSHLKRFPNLISLELLGPNLLNTLTRSHLICEIDSAIPNLKFLSLENIVIKHTKRHFEFSDDALTFEFVRKLDSEAHPLTMVQQKDDDEILPYEKYKKQDNTEKIPLFMGFKRLLLLRITHCNLNNVHWTMFDGLHDLHYLILNRNNIRFIPPFTFYGTPNLKTLSLSHNDLLDIYITDLAGLLELEYLDLSFNNFTQLSELSLPPFPKLKLANFGNNPITTIFPNTFEVMNTTDSLIIGSEDVYLSLITNSFLGLTLLKALTLYNLNIKLLKRDLFVGMPNLNELTLTGDIARIDYDTFLEVFRLKKLFLSNCKIRNISMDAFIGLENLSVLDLSQNELEYLPPAVFDQLINIKEIYLNKNKFQILPRDIFSKIHPKLIRLNENPWDCSCAMSEWKPMLINKIKQKVIKQCDFSRDKGVGCDVEHRFAFKYVYENKVAPKCVLPKQYVNWSVFHVMRRLLKCPQYKPKIKKHPKKNITETPTINEDNLSKIGISKIETLRYKLMKHNTASLDSQNQEMNDLNALPLIPNQSSKSNQVINQSRENFYKTKRIVKKYKRIIKSNNVVLNNSI